MTIEEYLKAYLTARPLFLSVLRAKECKLYEQYLPFSGPSLDYGCGDGFFAKTTFGKKSIDVGLDIGDSRIDQASESGAYKKIISYDGVKIPFPARSHQSVVSNSVLEHVSGLPKALKEIYRILKPGGIFYTTVMAKPWEEYLFGNKIFGNAYKDYMRKKQVHVNLFTYQEWKDAFSDAGFTVKKSIGHVSPTASTLLDLLHYASVPSLISFVMVKRWVLFPHLARLYPTKWLASHIEQNVKPEIAGSVFFVLTKSPRAL